MNANLFEILATIFFAGAVVHTFLASQFKRWGNRYPQGSLPENTLHLLGEVEVVFGLWSSVFLLLVMLLPRAGGSAAALDYLNSLEMTEPAFIFVVMAIAATRPVMALAEAALRALAKGLPIPARTAQIAVTLALGPLLGSFITEPAAMTVCALLIAKSLFSQPTSDRLRYAALAVLLVNISVGGVLTPFAAPPVLMVASTWGWDLSFMLTWFGPRAVMAVLINTALFLGFFWRELNALDSTVPESATEKVPLGLSLIHVVLLGAVVMAAHQPRVFTGLFLLFLGVVQVTREYQDELKLRESLLVAFFLAGLVVLGNPQRWWLIPAAEGIGDLPLFFGATALTAILDNAALTYLGTQVSSLTVSARYFLVAGAIAGGGLTVIANAPNPIGFSVLQKYFAGEAVSPLRLLAVAVVPTVVALLCLGLGA